MSRSVMREKHIPTSSRFSGALSRSATTPWEKMRSTATSRSWCTDLARRQGLGFWPGEDFLGKGWVRIAAVSNPMPEWSQSIAELKFLREQVMK